MVDMYTINPSTCAPPNVRGDTNDGTVEISICNDRYRCK